MTALDRLIKTVSDRIPNSVLPSTRIEIHPSEWLTLADEIAQLRLDLAQHKGNASEVIRLQAKLKEIARLLDEGAYGMATDEARGA